MGGDEFDLVPGSLREFPALNPTQVRVRKYAVRNTQLPTMSGRAMGQDAR